MLVRLVLTMLVALIPGTLFAQPRANVQEETKVLANQELETVLDEAKKLLEVRGTK